MAVSEQEVADLLAGMTRVHLAIVRGLSQNHPRTAENIIRALHEEAQLATGSNSSVSLAGLPARYLLSLLEARPPNRGDLPAADPQPVSLVIRATHRGRSTAGYS